MKEKEKKIIGWEWAPDEKIEITGAQFNYINQLAEMFKPLMSIASGTLAEMAKNGKAKPVYEQDDTTKAEESTSKIEVIPHNTKETEESSINMAEPKMSVVKD